MRKLYNLKTTILLTLLLTTPTLYSQPLALTDTVISGLSSPIQLVNAGDGSNRLFIVQQGGTILVYDQNFASLGTFLTVSDVTTGGEQGLLSMVFHPEYENAASPFFGHFYVYYTNTGGNLEVARYIVSGNANVADAASKEIVITIPHLGQSNHNGATLHFGNDGYLYFATGDGGGGGDVPNNAQNGEVLLGKMLRINVTSSTVAPFYTIPVDNPFVGVADFEPEIYALGLRNPFRWSFDRLTNDMWIGDVGQGQWEEINFVPAGSAAGVNYGWRCYEGDEEFNVAGCGAASQYTFPVYVYLNPDPGPAAAVTGGMVYHGPITALQGTYIASDFYSGTFYLLSPNGVGGFNVTSQANMMEFVANFGEAENGEMYAVNLISGLIATVGVSAVLPVDLISFSATPESNSVHLNWKTSFEENVSRFEIQQSANVTDFSIVGSVAPTNNQGGSEYNFTHSQAPQGRSYYRLKIIDIDGRFEYSDVVSVNIDLVSGRFVRPSLISGGIMKVQLPGEFRTIEVISMNGSRVVNQNLSGRSGMIDVPLPAFIPAGTYIVQLKNDEQTLTQRVLIRD
jgi:glucose/arabinose dehydrogenase